MPGLVKARKSVAIVMEDNGDLSARLIIAHGGPGPYIGASFAPVLRASAKGA
jgi:hypothetical protein